MAQIVPFRGIRYDLTKAGPADKLLAPPYDVISDTERGALAALSPHNVVRLILPEGEGDTKYTNAATELRRWIDEGVLRRDDKPAFYRYHQTFTAEDRTATRKGFICLVKLHRFDEGVVLPHERTLAGPKADRLKLKRACRAHLSQVFGLYSDPQRVTDRAFEALEATPPDLDATTTDRVHQRMWRLTDPAAQAQVARALANEKIYIADGHHRYETMLALREELRKEAKSPRSLVEYGTIFLANMDDPSLLVFPTHRVVHGLPSFDLERVLSAARACFHVDSRPMQPAPAVRALLAEKGAKGPTFALVTGDRIHYLTLREGLDLELAPGLAGPAVSRTLDVTLLHALVLEGILGIDRAAQEKQTNLRYIKDTKLALDEARSAQVQAVFVMNPTKVGEVKAVADAGEVMPQKSTFFYPKLASGLVISPLIPSEEVPG